MYLTSLPDHSDPTFDEQLHFSRFKQSNVIVNTQAQAGGCDAHVGCLSIKTVLSGEEWYGVGNRKLAVRPGQFLILNDDQSYSCQVKQAHILSVFFRKEFAASVFHDYRTKEESLIDNPFHSHTPSPEFFQTLHAADVNLQLKLSSLVSAVEQKGYYTDEVSEHLLYLLHDLIHVHANERIQLKQVGALKLGTRVEIYKRLCLAKDVLHSSFTEKTELATIASAACLSVPQLIRQFKLVFHCTPHQYLMQLRLEHAARLLKQTDEPINEITLYSGFENSSAFCRAFKVAYGVSPETFRRQVR